MSDRLYEILVEKIEDVRSFYSGVLEYDDQKFVNINDAKLFESMQRWHSNTHTSGRDWIQLFKKVQSRL